MKKILELGPEQFMTGIAAGSQLQNTGLFTRAEGITTVRNPFIESDDFGILQASPAPEDLTGSTILDTPIAWAIDPVDSDTGFGKVYFWGANGYLYSISLVGDASPVNINVEEELGGMTLGANGLFVMTHDNGEKRVWYFRREAIGFYDLSGAASFNNDIYAGLEDTMHHPVHKLFDRIYFGNGRFIGLVEDDGAGGLNVDNGALDLQAGMTVTTVSDDGHYLVIGATTNPPVPGGGAGSLPHGTTKIFFWDTNSSSWEREWIINDSAVYAIRRVGSVMQALTGRGIYAFTIDTPPQMILPFMNAADAPSSQYPSHFMADVLGEALVWANAAGSVSSWGKFTPAMKNAYIKPFSGFGGSDLSLICANAKTNDLYVGSGQSELYRVKWTGGDALIGVTAETVFIELKRWWQVGRVVIEFEGRLGEGDELNIWLRADSRTDPTLFGTISYETHGPITSCELYGSFEARSLALLPGFAGGAVRIRNMEVWGDPIERPVSQQQQLI